MKSIRRQFVDVAEGQVLYRQCGDPAKPPLVMLHGSPGSGYSLVPLMRHLAERRCVYALDTLGNGDSSPAAADQPSIEDLADGHWRAIRGIGLGRFDLYGYHTGAGIACELSIRHGDSIGRIVMDGVSVFDPNARADLLDNDHAPDIPVDLDGTQFVKVWSMVRDAHIFWPWWNRGAGNRRPLGLPDADDLHGEVLEVLKACRSYNRSYRAALDYPKRTKLPQVRNGVVVTACPSDQLYGHLDAAVKLIPGALKAVTPERSRDSDLAATAMLMLDFLDTGRI